MPFLRQSKRKQTEANAIAAPPALEPSSGLSEADREELAEKLGYRQIGAELPDNVTLGQIVQTLPKDVRESTSSNKPLHKLRSTDKPDQL